MAKMERCYYYYYYYYYKSKDFSDAEVIQLKVKSCWYMEAVLAGCPS